MLPDNFDFAMLPPPGDYNLYEIGMLASTIENIDFSITSWLKEDLNLSATSNHGFSSVPVLWQAPERAYQVKHNKALRDDAGALKLPIISIERTGITKDPNRKGAFQANYYSKNRNGRSGRLVIARRIVEDKTRNYAVVGNTRRANYTGGVGLAAATATITITDFSELNAGDKVNLVATDGTDYNFTQGDQSSVNGTWEATTSNAVTATNLMNVINTSSGPAGTRFTATVDGAVITVTQSSAGSAGNTAITITDSGGAGLSKTNFGGGTSGPQRYYPRVNKKIVVQSLSIPIPVYVNIDYKIIIKSEYQQQMNELVAPFIARTGQINAFTMKRNGHLYEGFIDQGFTHNNNVANLNEELRLYSSEITIRVLGYLIGEGENDDRPLVRIDENVVEYLFPSESPVPEGDENLFLP
tara:strand:+ start:2616 stop:3854 length:1239 start_codon:yes stop_codon:yes gene_type:complete